ncbi:MAG: hypothetical protein IPF73_10575 [Betaproteobacteria bacterium]|nr:hypothetical protein [Betaproteobacteria bacterium]
MTKGRDDFSDDAVDRLLREHSRETPPASLDDAIRAAAHRAVGSKPAVAEAREPWRWWMPLAAAATIGAIAIGVIQNLPNESTEPMIVSDSATGTREPAAESRAPAAAPVAPASPQPEIAPTAPGASGAVRQQPATASVERAAAPAPARAQPPAEAPSTRLAETPATGKRRVDTTTESKELLAAAKPAAEQVAAQRAPDAQVAALAKRAEGDTAEARKVERESTSGFVASPPPAAAPPVAAAAPAPAAAPAAASGLAAAPSGMRGAENATDAAARPKLAARAPATSMADAREAAATRDRAAAAPAGAQGSAVKLPDAFVAEIRRLLAANDGEGAARELRAFRQAYADADTRLPVELRAWASGVTR